MLRAEIVKHKLKFNFPAGTSRGVLNTKDSWFIILSDQSDPDIRGVGECSIIAGLSIDDRPDFESVLNKICSEIDRYAALTDPILDEFPSIRFGIETALKDLENNASKLLFPSKFTSGEDSMHINGLIWMGTPEFMRHQLKTKVSEGYKCIKIKIGAIDFQEEISIIRDLREMYPAKEMMIRLDANGAFNPDEAMHKLELLSKLDVHSIEQPIKKGQVKEMAELCRQSPIPIALDEELIGIADIIEKKRLLQTLKPQFIILKPSLIGGFDKSKDWIDLAEQENIQWWVTSALESNIG